MFQTFKTSYITFNWWHKSESIPLIKLSMFGNSSTALSSLKGLQKVMIDIIKMIGFPVENFFF